MTTRLFQAIPLKEGERVWLDAQASHHLAGVLRARRGDTLTLFNGEGGEFAATLLRIEHRKVEVAIGAWQPRNIESPLRLHLGQGISRGEKMDFTLQKAVELGVSAVTPLLTTRCNVRLQKERFEKKWHHWRAIAVHACEQCGRNTVPEIFPPMTLTGWLETLSVEQGFVLDPRASDSLKTVLAGKTLTEAALLIGPEGGLDEEEIRQALSRQFVSLSLGPRILRTETAGLAAISALQCLSGDLG